MDVQIKLSGFKELDQAFAEIPVKVARTILRDGTKAGMDVIERKAEQNLNSLGTKRPLKHGKYFRRTVSSHAGGGSVKAVLGLAKRFWYLKWLEVGSSGHAINAKKEPLLIFYSYKLGSWFKKKKVEVKGIVAHPFLRPALYNNLETVINTCGDYWYKKIKEEFDKMQANPTVQIIEAKVETIWQIEKMKKDVIGEGVPRVDKNWWGWWFGSHTNIGR